MAATVKAFSDEKAASLMNALREGKTPKAAGVKMRRVEAYCLANPAFAAEASPLVTANMAAMHQEKLDRLARIRQRSADVRRNAERCSKGHIRTLETTFYVVSEGKLVRRCKICAKLSKERQLPTLDQVRQVIADIEEGNTLNSSRIVPAATMRNVLRQNPKLGSRLKGRRWLRPQRWLFRSEVAIGVCRQ